MRKTRKVKQVQYAVLLQPQDLMASRTTFLPQA
jgi:hypothetical protein